MAPRSRTAAALLACGLTIGSGGAVAIDPMPDFGDRVASYVTLRSRFEEPLPSYNSGRSAWSEVTDVPPGALHALPPLPPGLAYRLVGADLVLWDAHAEIVVDVLPAAIR